MSRTSTIKKKRSKPLDSEGKIWDREDQKKKRSSLHLLRRQQGPVAAVHLPLHYTDSPSAHPLLSFPILSIWFVHLRSSAAALCRAAAQREAPGARLESPSSTGSQRMFQLICFVPVDTKIKTNKVKQYIYFHYLLEVNSSWCSGSSSSGKQTWIHFGVEKERKDKYAAFQGTTTAFPDPHIIPSTIDLVVLELIKSGRRT